MLLCLLAYVIFSSRVQFPVVSFFLVLLPFEMGHKLNGFPTACKIVCDYGNLFLDIVVVF
jgi:hypothetical protein